ncbi:MAG: hypothetical protein LBD10_14930 [Desulfobulbus sp.]|jgi:tetratricopeptide (TPR) repeat protein|uniref:hypothetical protein n=1 Tax=Desulfobulbus sp. TaxID=895 RepID=UPI0028433106|nr:hypothetical protein [Desulfobulbus sp.]MDR2551483.1 hypothetical protein [Desulfobulbus sp.]
MATGSQQVTEDYEQLKELLELYPNIAIVGTEGQPPDSYEIEYTLRGFVKEDDASIGIGQTHRVRLSLPFGYPHFAPIAKPLTPVFHPDFDPSAIRLADYWQQNPSLPELVLHIGEMICGSIYNLEDPFNQEAAEWYRHQRAQLPLDTVTIADIEATTSDLDALDDGDLGSLGLERRDVPPSQPLADQAEDNADIQYIRDLIDENKIFSANRLLAELPANAPVAVREELQQHIGKVLRKVDQLFKLAEQLESMAKLTEAMEVADNIKTLAADAPGADALKRKIQQALQAAPPKSGQKTESKPAAPVSPPLPAKLAGKPLAWLGSVSFKPIAAAIVVLATAILAITLYFKDQNTLDRAQASLREGQLLVEKRQFEQALETLEGGKAMLSGLTILRAHKGTQEQAIDNLISSTDLQEGLKGRVLYQGEYIPTSVAASLEELSGLTDQAQTLVGQNKIEQALPLYRQALKFAADRNLSKQQASISEIVQSLELRHTLAAAEKAEQGKNWDEAADAYRKALNLSGKMMNLGTTSDITSRMTAATFRHELDQSKKAFTQSQWKETIKYLEQAQQAIDANPSVVSEKERQDLHLLLVNSRLYFMLSTAREAYEQKNWSQAIEEYQNALNLLTSEPESTGTLRGESVGKIEKTLLMVKIAQIQDQILAVEGKEDPSLVLNRYKEIQRIIKESAHQNDPAVKGVAQKVAEKIEKQQEVLLERDKVTWLEEHFEEIFRANYPTFKGSRLSQPKAVFSKKVGSRLVFTLTCMERSPGSSSKLELNYQFDTSNGRWSVYNY